MTEYRTASLPAGTWVPTIVDRHWLYALDPNGASQPICLAYLPWVEDVVVSGLHSLYLVGPDNSVSPLTVEPAWKPAPLREFAAHCRHEIDRYRKRAA